MRSFSPSAAILISLGAAALAADDPTEVPRYANHVDLSYVIEGSQRKEIRTKADWELRRRHVLASLQKVMGPLPGRQSRVALDVQIAKEVRLGTMVRRKLTYQSDADDRVAAYLFLPDSDGKQLPAVLCLQQTTKLGKDEPAGLGGDPNLHYALELAKRGYVTLAPDYPSFGEHPYDFAESHGYESGSMKAVWDNIRAVDLLESLPEVDSEKIGVIGHSLGGHSAMFTAAFEPRLKAIVSSCGFTRFGKDDLPSWTGPRYMPRIASAYGNDITQVPFDFPEIVASFAPRAFFASAAKKDDDFDVTGVEDALKAARVIYELYGQTDRLQAFYPDGGHGFPREARMKAYEFLDLQLRR